MAHPGEGHSIASLLRCCAHAPKPERAKQVADREAGVDCKRILKAAASSRSTSAAVKQRFREGSIDEVSFLGGLLEARHPCSNHSPRSALYQDDPSLGVRMQMCASIIPTLAVWMTQREVMREPVIPHAEHALTALHVHACRAGPGAPRLPDGGPRGGLLAGGRGDCLLIALPPHRQV